MECQRGFTISELRTIKREEAAAEGKTLEQIVDEMERFTGTEYANCLRLLYGIPTKETGGNGSMKSLALTQEEKDIIAALRDPEKRAAMMKIKEQSEQQALPVA